MAADPDNVAAARQRLVDEPEADGVTWFEGLEMWELLRGGQPRKMTAPEQERAQAIMRAAGLEQNAKVTW